VLPGGATTVVPEGAGATTVLGDALGAGTTIVDGVWAMTGGANATSSARPADAARIRERLMTVSFRPSGDATAMPPTPP
jgi:hypothetical protein